jgi:hypothetical protein
MAQSPYSLKTVEARPVPKAEHFQLRKGVGLKICAEARWGERLGLTVSECRANVSKRANLCARQRHSERPDLIDTTAVSQQLARGFLECAMPYPQCNSTEVRTETEARQRCR